MTRNQANVGFPERNSNVDKLKTGASNFGQYLAPFDVAMSSLKVKLHGLTVIYFKLSLLLKKAY